MKKHVFRVQHMCRLLRSSPPWVLDYPAWAHSTEDIVTFSALGGASLLLPNFCKFNWRLRFIPESDRSHCPKHSLTPFALFIGNLPNAGGAYPSVGGVLKGKRGIAYNDVSATVPYVGSELFGWGFNWISNSAGLSNQVSYIPTLHNAESTFTSSWMSDAQAAIDAGAEYLFGFNEPGEQ